MAKPDIVVAGAGINGLVAANYLQRSGCNVTLIERAPGVGGACVSEVAEIDGVSQQYALGASVLGLMQDFVFEETGLSGRLQTFVPEHPKLVFFPGDRFLSIRRPRRRVSLWFRNLPLRLCHRHAGLYVQPAVAAAYRWLNKALRTTGNARPNG